MEGPTADAIPECQNAGTVPLYRLRMRDENQTVSPTEETTGSDGGTSVNINDISILRINGQRETPSGPEYRCLGEVWLRADLGVPSDLLRNYRRHVAQKDRLATLAKRKRATEEVDSVGAAGGVARKKAKQA